MDTALGAEEMVETLTDKNLELEDKIEQLTENINDLVSTTPISVSVLLSANQPTSVCVYF